MNLTAEHIAKIKMWAASGVSPELTDLYTICDMALASLTLREEGYRQGLEAAAKLVDHILKEGGGTYGDAIRALVPIDAFEKEQRNDT